MEDCSEHQLTKIANLFALQVKSIGADYAPAVGKCRLKLTEKETLQFSYLKLISNESACVRSNLSGQFACSSLDTHIIHLQSLINQMCIFLDHRSIWGIDAGATKSFKQFECFLLDLSLLHRLFMIMIYTETFKYSHLHWPFYCWPACSSGCECAQWWLSHGC